MYPLKRFLAKLSHYYRLDPRALSLLRMGVALLVLADLCIRGGDLQAFYTDKGIWSVSTAYSFGWLPGFWSVHTLSGAFYWELILFIVHAIAALSLLAGYRTRLATLLVWLLTISLHNRNLYVLQSGDDLLRLLLFWGLFLPWNACYSIDARQGRVNAIYRPLAGFAYLLLLASVYFFTVVLKTGSDWHSDNTAVYYALSLEQLRLPAGDWLYRYHGLMRSLTQLVFYAELILPFLILFPSKKGTPRLIAFILILILQTGIGLTLYVGLFFIISMVAALGLLPAFAMDRLAGRLPVSLKKTVTPSRLRFQTLRNTLCVMAMILCLTFNLSAVSWFNYELRDELKYIANGLRLNQYWGMFSPGVLRRDGWFVYQGIDKGGNAWDLRTNSDIVDFNKPEHIVQLYKNDRWRKLAENMQISSFTFLRPLFCSYTLRHWNEQHPEKHITLLNLYFIEKTSLAAYKSAPVIKLLYCVCNDR